MMKDQIKKQDLQPDYASLTPDVVVDAVESIGYISDLRILALNSYENRVYQVGIEEQSPLIVKFYRPNRWSDEQIHEEHRFSEQLLANDIPAVPPLADESGDTLHQFHGYRFSVYKRQGGRAPELSDLENLYQLGRFLGRLHASGAIEDYKYRPTITPQSFMVEPSAYLLANNFIPGDLLPAYQSLMPELIEMVQSVYQQCDFQTIRLHGDCHVGNILWTDTGPHFVDFDDSRMGPAIQDIWMLLSGDMQEQQLQLQEILEGYQEFNDFNKAEILLIESLRTMRIVHYAAWLAQRWQDPAFPIAFPWFNGQRYWEQHILELREQFANLQQKPLSASWIN